MRRAIAAERAAIPRGCPNQKSNQSSRCPYPGQAFARCYNEAVERMCFPWPGMRAAPGRNNQAGVLCRVIAKECTPLSAVSGPLAKACASLRHYCTHFASEGRQKPARIVRFPHSLFEALVQTCPVCCCEVIALTPTRVRKWEFLP